MESAGGELLRFSFDNRILFTRESKGSSNENFEGNDFETFKELLRVNDSRATVLFFFFTVRRQYKSGVSVLTANSLNPRKLTFQALAKTLKYLEAQRIISNRGGQ